MTPTPDPALIDIEVKGLDLLAKALGSFEPTIQADLRYAAREAGEYVLNTQGLRRYPPATAANQPPPPFYIRGRGTQKSLSAKGQASRSLNDGKSERLGTQFWIKNEPPTGARIGNRASYAKYVVGHWQPPWMTKIGWRKLYDVAVEKKPGITKIFQAWIDKTLTTLKLK